MELPYSCTMTYCNQCDTLLLHVSVELAFYIDTHSTGALVQNSILRLVVKKSAHC